MSRRALVAQGSCLALAILALGVAVMARPCVAMSSPKLAVAAAYLDATFSRFYLDDEMRGRLDPWGSSWYFVSAPPVGRYQPLYGRVFSSGPDRIPEGATGDDIEVSTDILTPAAHLVSAARPLALSIVGALVTVLVATRRWTRAPSPEPGRRWRIGRGASLGIVLLAWWLAAAWSLWSRSTHVDSPARAFRDRVAEWGDPKIHVPLTGVFACGLAGLLVSFGARPDESR